MRINKLAWYSDDKASGTDSSTKENFFVKHSKTLGALGLVGGLAVTGVNLLSGMKGLRDDMYGVVYELNGNRGHMDVRASSSMEAIDKVKAKMPYAKNFRAFNIASQNDEYQQAAQAPITKHMSMIYYNPITKSYSDEKEKKPGLMDAISFKVKTNLAAGAINKVGGALANVHNQFRYGPNNMNRLQMDYALQQQAMRNDQMNRIREAQLAQNMQSNQLRADVTRGDQDILKTQLTQPTIQ